MDEGRELVARSCDGALSVWDAASPEWQLKLAHVNSGDEPGEELGGCSVGRTGSIFVSTTKDLRALQVCLSSIPSIALCWWW